MKVRRSDRTTRRYGGGGLARVSAIAVIALMLAIAVMPLLPAGASAANNDRKINANVVLSDTTVQDIKIKPPTGDPTETPITGSVDDLVAVTVEPTLDDPIAVGTVQINKLGCDDDYDGDYDQLAANCVPMDADFTVLSGGGEASHNGSFTDNAVVAGDMQVIEFIPDGYGQPIVFCDSYLADGSESGFWQANVDGGTLNYGIQGGEWLYCEWFNVPGSFVDLDADGHIFIAKYVCPQDYSADEHDFYEFADDCTQQIDGVKFELMLEDNTVAEQTTGDNITGAVDFENLPPSTYGVKETIPAGYGTPAVWCIREETDTQVQLELLQQGVATDYTDVELKEGESLLCWWFNIPTSEGTITINKWECPEGLAFVVEPTVDDMLSACDQAMDGVDFFLDYPSDDLLPDQTRTTGDDGAGTAIFHNVQAGDVTVTEDIPSGYGDPMVYCGWGAIQVNDGQAIAIDGYIPLATLQDGVLEHEMRENETLVCQWFNMPNGDGDILVHKWDCPEDWDAYNWSYDDLIVHCSEPYEGIDFTLTEKGGDPEVVYDIENTDANGDAPFSGVPAGDYGLTEAMPTGYGTPIVYCYLLDGEIQQYDVTEAGRIELELHENEQLICDWFNVPSDDGSITVYKYTCPEGYDIYAAWADPKTDCTAKTNGIDYVLNAFSGGDIYATTGDSFDGGWKRGSLAPDSYTITEDVPSGTIATFVTCQWLDKEGPYYWDSFQPYNLYGAGTGTSIDVDLQKSVDIVCQWYNVPDYDGGELIVIKYWCDGNIYDEQHCDLYGGGADFEIEPAYGGGSPIDFSTGADATAHLYLYPGEYSLIEVGRTWCKAESDQVNGDGNVEVYDGQTSYVIVYNCGPGKVKEPPVKKFPNTGVGPAELTTSNDVSGLTMMMAIVGVVVSAGAARVTGRMAIAKVKRAS